MRSASRSLGRLVLEGLIPLAMIVLVLRDRPSQVRAARWATGGRASAIGLAGCAVMTPIVLALVRLPAFAGYYAPQAAAPLDVVLTTALEVIPAEFFFRGFLLFALLRVAGPIAVVIATLPFAFAHLGKPEVETLSTLVGGLLYGWLDWRTGSVLWSGLAHTWILSLAVIGAGAAAAAPAAERRGTPPVAVSSGAWPVTSHPAEIIALAEARAAARRARDWTTADDLLAEIQAAGLEGGGQRDDVRPRAAGAPGRRRGRRRQVRLQRVGAHRGSTSRPTGVASVVLVATDWPDDLARAMRALAAHAPAGTQVVVVANDPSDAQAAALAGLDAGTADAAAPAARIEVVWTATRLGWAAALNAGIRRAAAPVVILLDTSVEPVGDLVTALAAALEDPTVAVAGPFGLVSDRHAPLRGCPGGRRRRRRHRGLRAGVPALRLRRPRAARRALRLLSQPRHLVEPRPAGPGRGRGRGCAAPAGGPGRRRPR